MGTHHLTVPSQTMDVEYHCTSPASAKKAGVVVATITLQEAKIINDLLHLFMSHGQNVSLTNHQSEAQLRKIIRDTIKTESCHAQRSTLVAKDRQLKKAIQSMEAIAEGCRKRSSLPGDAVLGRKRAATAAALDGNQ